MAEEKNVGAKVSHNGTEDFLITKVDGPITTFENERFRVKCSTDELEWLEEDGAWCLPGRLLSKEQRLLYLQKSRQQNLLPEHHPAARKFLRAHGLIK